MIPLMYFTINQYAKWDWEAISAISNMAVAIATFLAVIVSLWIATTGSKAKTKILLNVAKHDSVDVSFRLVNVGLIPVTIIRKGFVYDTPFWKRKRKKKIAIKSEAGKWLLDQSEHINVSMDKYNFSRKYIEMGFKPKESIKLIVLFIDNKEKMHFQRFNFEIIDPDKKKTTLKINPKFIKELEKKNIYTA